MLGKAALNYFLNIMKNMQHASPAMASTQKDLVDDVLSQFPKLVSPKAHAIFDALAFPAMLPLVIYLAKKNPKVGLIMGLNLAVEGGVSLFTNYPPAIIPKISFRDHIRIGMVFAPLSSALSLLTPGLTKRERLVLSLVPLVPFILNGISKPTSN